jgi:hypothetical protein
MNDLLAVLGHCRLQQDVCIGFARTQRAGHGNGSDGLLVFDRGSGANCTGERGLREVSGKLLRLGVKARETVQQVAGVVGSERDHVAGHHEIG